MQEIPLAIHAVLVAIIFWRMWHLLKTLAAGTASDRDLVEVGIDGLALGLCGQLVTGADLRAALLTGLGTAAVFYTLATLGLRRPPQSEDSPPRRGASDGP